MRAIALVLACLFAQTASAHPNDPTYWSLRTFVRTSDTSLQIIVGLEIPLGTVLTGITESAGMVAKVSARHEREYTESQWRVMSEGLVLKADGKRVNVEFRPIQHPINGKAGEQFVVYLVGAQLDDLAGRFGDEVTLELENTIYPDAPMYLSAFANAASPWVITENSARKVLGDIVDVEEASELPAAWKRDAGLRQLRLKLARKP
ncbi:MAG: hypothetical protein AAGA48_26850 [Myxococcota bacterium]